MKRVSLFFALAAFAVLLGAGCSSDQNQPQNLDPVAAAERLQFLPGDTFEVRQTFLGFGGFLPDLFNNKKGVRMVTVNRFAPMNLAEIAWKIEIDEETEASRRARADYEKRVAEGDTSAIPPEIDMRTRTAEGTVSHINLKDAHATFLPTYWKEGESNAANTGSGIWLSDDAFLELQRTGKTKLSFGVLDASVSALANGAADLQSAIATLRQESSEDSKNRDLTFLQAEPEPIEYTLTVNGKQMTVSAIKAHNWFGEVIVLNSRQNPMILKLTMNPLFAGASEVFATGTESLNRMFGYEITNLQLQYPEVAAGE